MAIKFAGRIICADPGAFASVSGMPHYLSWGTRPEVRQHLHLKRARGTASSG